MHVAGPSIAIGNVIMFSFGVSLSGIGVLADVIVGIVTTSQ